MYVTFASQKKHTHKPLTEEEVGGTPHSFVLHRGHVGSALLQLEMDLRHVMEPYTALNLKVGHKPGQSELVTSEQHFGTNLQVMKSWSIVWLLEVYL